MFKRPVIVDIKWIVSMPTAISWYKIEMILDFPSQDHKCFETKASILFFPRPFSH